MRATYKVKSLGFVVPHFSLSLACVASVCNRVRPNFSRRTRAETLATQATLSPPRLASLAWRVGGGGGGGGAWGNPKINHNGLVSQGCSQTGERQYKRFLVSRVFQSCHPDPNLRSVPSRMQGILSIPNLASIKFT